MARIVQIVLNQWRNKIRAAGEEVNKAADHESAALSDLRRCLGRRDFNKVSRSDPDLIERKELVGSLPKLLLEEAYSQYNRHSRSSHHDLGRMRSQEQRFAQPVTLRREHDFRMPTVPPVPREPDRLKPSVKG